MTFQNGQSVISETMKLKLAENGIPLEILQNIYAQFGKNGLLAVLALPILSTKQKNKSQARITRHH